MKFYNIDDSYISYLRTKDSKVLENEKSYIDYNARPYIGIVLSVNYVNYFVPLSSPKAKHERMKNSDTLHKIKYIKSDGSSDFLGVVNINNMIPVPVECLKIVDISNIDDIEYRNLLRIQYNELLKVYDSIQKKCNKVYNVVCSDKEGDYANIIRSLCCDFRTLEEMCREYKNK